MHAVCWQLGLHLLHACSLLAIGKALHVRPCLRWNVDAPAGCHEACATPGTQENPWCFSSMAPATRWPSGNAH